MKRKLCTAILITCLFFVASNISCFSAKPPERGTIRIPEMKINSLAITSLLDSIMDFASSRKAYPDGYNIYLDFSTIEADDDYALVVVVENTTDMPWSNDWFAYCKINGIICFMDEMFTFFFTESKKSSYRTFDYSYAKERKTITPIYEWDYLITPVANGVMKFKLIDRYKPNQSPSQGWMQNYDKLREWEEQAKWGDDWPRK